MRFFLRSSKPLRLLRKYTWPVVGVAAITTFVVGASRQAYSPIVRRMSFKGDKTITAKTQSSSKPTTNPSSGSGRSASSGVSAGGQVEADQTPTFSHVNITTTIFWVGEPADADNDYIANDESAWDEQWKTHFGGFDDPDHRSGYLPAAFTPKENPFYFALPYSDIDDNGNRKASATSCPNYPAMKDQPYSWCKNSWLAIRYNGKIVYAQWEDVGPYQEDDTAYVFGSAAPKNKIDVKAGLDVSPAVRDYLGLGDVSSCDWAFVSVGGVPEGPWSQIVTSDLGDSI